MSIEIGCNPTAPWGSKVEAKGFSCAIPLIQEVQRILTTPKRIKTPPNPRLRHKNRGKYD